VWFARDVVVRVCPDDHASWGTTGIELDSYRFPRVVTVPSLVGLSACVVLPRVRPSVIRSTKTKREKASKDRCLAAASFENEEKQKQDATDIMSASNGDSRKDPPPPPPPPPGMLLAGRFPVNSLQEVTLHDGATFAGRVYCTDEMTGSLVLKSSLVHTTLACEMRIINVASIETSKVLPEGTTDAAADSSPSAASLSALDLAPPPELPLPKIQKKALEERERKALKLAEERFRQINQKVRGQAA
jgi:hypothetical protein